MNPKARGDGIEAINLGGLAALIWSTADGTRSVGDLAALASRELGGEIDSEQVFAALDQLADAGLLAERIAPPVGVRRISRRQVVGGLGLAAAAAGFAAAFFPKRALAEGADAAAPSAASKEQLKKATAAPNHQEQLLKGSAAPAHSEQEVKRSASPAHAEQLKKQSAAPSHAEQNVKAPASAPASEQKKKLGTQPAAQEQRVKRTATEQHQKLKVNSAEQLAKRGQ